MLLHGTIIHAQSLGKVQIDEDRLLEVKDDKITAIMPFDQTYFDNYEGEKMSLSSDQFLCPGFIDTHIHAPQYPNSGIGMDLPLLGWLEKYTFPTESSFKDEKKAKTVYRKVVERTLANGTTTASYFGSTHLPASNILADLCLELGQRAYIGKCCIDWNAPEYYIETEEESFQTAKESIEYCRRIDPQGSQIQPIVTPRFAPSCKSDLLKSLAKLAAENDCNIQTHSSENIAEVEWVAELFPKSESYIGVYRDHNLLTAKTTLAHCVFLSPEERALIKKYKSGVSHCPTSNTALASGIAEVRLMLDEGLKVSLGTDVSGGWSPSILEIIRQTSSCSRLLSHFRKDSRLQLSIEESFFLATMGGAQVLGIEDKVGSFEVGKIWDALLVDLSDGVGPVDLLGEKDWATKFAKWIWTGDDRNVRTVWVNGKVVKS